jgi:hypothetical protein
MALKTVEEDSSVDPGEHNPKVREFHREAALLLVRFVQSESVAQLKRPSQ